MNIFTFKGQLLEINGWHIVRIPKEISLKLSSRGMVMVNIHIMSNTKIMPLEPDGKGSHILCLSPSLLSEGSLEPSAIVSVGIEPTDEWYGPTLPDDLVESLNTNGLTQFYDGLTYKSQWDWVRWIRATKNPQTRNKRIEVAMSKLSSAERRPCCFNRNQCTLTDISKSGVLLS